MYPQYNNNIVKRIKRPARLERTSIEAKQQEMK
jgi:hypothetical protein